MALTSTLYPGSFFGLGTSELLVILLIVLLLFGGANLPRLFRSLGKSVGEFKAGLREDGDGQPEKPNDDPGKKDAGPAEKSS